jgi:hypothetical protein
MSFIVSQTIGTRKLSGFYRKVDTEGAASRFQSQEAGYQEVFEVADLTVESATSYLITLSSSYIVGAHQLIVALRFTDQLGYLVLPPRDQDTTGLSYEEVDSLTVRIYGVLGGANDFTHAMVVIPHTATPAVNREKVVVRDQGDNTAIELEGHGDGVMVRSPNGSKWLIRVDDSGNLVTESR